jgi:mono/diheme cytochrome c family protein
MRWTGWVAASTLAAAVGAGVLVSCNPNGSGAGSTAADQKLARGRYLLRVLACGDCHTPGTLYGVPDTTRLMAGSELGWRGAWGVSYPPNLTPDLVTGLGDWTEAQIVTALREGRRPDGSALLPPMPWPDYAALTDDDANALAAALKDLPPIKHQEPPHLPPDSKPGPHEMIFPPPPPWDLHGAPPADTTSAKKP